MFMMTSIPTGVMSRDIVRTCVGLSFAAVAVEGKWFLCLVMVGRCSARSRALRGGLAVRPGPDLRADQKLAGVEPVGLAFPMPRRPVLSVGDGPEVRCSRR
jgi:hypothetical protein